MDKRRIGGLLVGAAVLCLVAAFCWWQWENSDSRESDRRVDALSAAMGGAPYEEAEPNATPSLVLGGLGAVLFLGGIVLIAAPPDVSPVRDEPDASDRP